MRNLLFTLALTGLHLIAATQAFAVDWHMNYTSELISLCYNMVDAIYAIQVNGSYSIVKYNITTNVFSHVLDLSLNSSSRLILSSVNNHGAIIFCTEDGNFYTFVTYDEKVYKFGQTEYEIYPASNIVVKYLTVFFISPQPKVTGNASKAYNIVYLDPSKQSSRVVAYFEVLENWKYRIVLHAVDDVAIYVFVEGETYKGDKYTIIFQTIKVELYSFVQGLSAFYIKGHFASTSIANALKIRKFLVLLEPPKITYLMLPKLDNASDFVEMNLNKTDSDFQFLQVAVQIKSVLKIYVFANNLKQGISRAGVIDMCFEQVPIVYGTKISQTEWSTVAFHCDVPTSPKPFIFFYKESVPIVRDNYDSTVLHLPYVRSANSDGYKCVTSNICGDSGRYFTLNVTRRVALETKQKEVSVEPGNNITLTCDTIAYISTSVIWLKGEDNLSLRNDSRYNVTPQHDLQIQDVGKSDSGIYKCLIDVFKKGSNGTRNHTMDVITSLKVESKQNHSEGSPASISLYYVILPLILLSGAFVLIVGYVKNKSAKPILSKEEIRDFKQGCKLGGDEAMFGMQEAYREIPYDISYDLPSHSFQIERENVLGQGQFGIVYKGVLKVGDRLEDVAMKTTQPGQDLKYLKDLLCEIKILIHIGQHSQIIRLFGAYTRQLKQGIVYLALEFCSNGSLERYLRTSEYTNSEMIQSPESGEGKFITHSMQCKWKHQIANGMAYLGTKKVIHSDLATRNILLSANLSARITDFGLSRRFENYDNYVKTGSEPLPWRWMAIESLEYRNFSTESDVWSFGVTLWEICSMGKVPFQNESWSTDFLQQLKSGHRLSKPEHASEEEYEQMQRCWMAEPHGRPTFQMLSNFFQELCYEDQSIVYI